MVVGVETEAQREGTRVWNKGKWPGAQEGTVSALPTTGPQPCAKPLIASN